MTENPQEPSATGSAKIPAQHIGNTHARNFGEEAGICAGTASKDTTAVQEKILHTGTREWS
jgi:hypothetical protein